VNRVRRRPDGEANPIEGEKPSREAKTTKPAKQLPEWTVSDGLWEECRVEGRKTPRVYVSDGLWEESMQKVNETDKYNPV
jgi:hypothetical protein